MIVVDISCPACGAVDAVRKTRLAGYECGACGAAFTAAEYERYREDAGTH